MSITESQDPRSLLPRMALREYLPFRISILSEHLDRAISALYKKCNGISLSEWRVLVAVGSKPDMCSAQIARETQLDKVAVSRAVTGLIKRDYVTREVAPDDRRRSLLRLTRYGEAAYADTVSVALGVEKELLDTLDEVEIRALRDLNDRLLQRVGNILGQDIRTNTGDKSA